MSDSITVTLTRDEATQLWLQGKEARAIIAGFAPNQRAKYESQAWFTGAEKLQQALNTAQEHSSGQERVQVSEKELRIVADLLGAAEEMAQGLLGLLEHVYALDDRTKEALAAANRLSVVLNEERAMADERSGF